MLLKCELMLSMCELIKLAKKINKNKYFFSDHLNLNILYIQEDEFEPGYLGLNEGRDENTLI